MTLTKEKVQDLRFSGLETVLFSCLESGHYSPFEIRLATESAIVLYEERHVDIPLITNPQIHERIQAIVNRFLVNPD